MRGEALSRRLNQFSKTAPPLCEHGFVFLVSVKSYDHFERLQFGLLVKCNALYRK